MVVQPPKQDLLREEQRRQRDEADHGPSRGEETPNVRLGMRRGIHARKSSRFPRLMQPVRAPVPRDRPPAGLNQRMPA
jgi:hypothetical protein